MRKVNKGVARCEVLTPRPTSAHTRVRVNISNQRPSPHHLVIKPIWTRAFSTQGLFKLAHTPHMCPNLKTYSLAGGKTRCGTRFIFFSEETAKQREIARLLSFKPHTPSFATDLSSLDKRKTRPCWSFNFNGIYQKPSLVHYHPGTHPSSSCVALNYIRSENHRP